MSKTRTKNHILRLVQGVIIGAGAILPGISGGVLAVNERGMDADGQIKCVRPHPNFRIFFTMDPHNGEISRAMRNRGIEICLRGKTL